MSFEDRETAFNSTNSDRSSVAAQECQDVCYLSEGADGDNKNGVCKGQCINVGHPAPIFTCRGT